MTKSPLTMDEAAAYQKWATEYVFIYFVQVGDFIKIGHSRQWKKRVCNMRTASPYEVKVLHVEGNYPTYEDSLHIRFKHHYHRGEWFHAHQEILDFIAKRIANGHSIIGRTDVKLKLWGDGRKRQ